MAEWIGPQGGGLFNSTANWSTGAVPTGTTSTNYANSVTPTVYTGLQTITINANSTFSGNVGGVSSADWVYQANGSLYVAIYDNNIRAGSSLTINAITRQAGSAGNTNLNGAGTLIIGGGAFSSGSTYEWVVSAGTLKFTADYLSTAAPQPVTVSSGATLITNPGVNLANPTDTFERPVVVNGGTASIGGHIGRLDFYGTGVSFTNTAAAQVYSTDNNVMYWGNASGTTTLTIPSARTIYKGGTFALSMAASGLSRMAVYTSGAVSVDSTVTSGNLLMAPTSGAQLYYGSTGGTFNNAAGQLVLMGYGAAAAGGLFVGDFNNTTASLGGAYIGNSSTAGCVLNITGSTNFQVGTAGFIFGGANATGASYQQILTVDGANTNNARVTASSATLALSANSATGHTFINLKDNGATGGFSIGTVGGANATGATPKTINLWGGRLTLGSGGLSPASSGGTLRLMLHAGLSSANRFNVASGTATISVPIEQPAVTSYGAPATLNFTGGTGYIGAPVIRVTGGSPTVPATARAVYSAGSITSIVVTNPGVGYTSSDVLTFVATGGNGTITPGNTATVAQTTDIGFTKEGAGTLVLSAANTYRGATLISDGTLSVGAGGTAGTISSAAVTLSGAGILNLNRSDAVTYSNAISGPNTTKITRTGAASNTAATLNANNSGFAGGFDIAANNVLIADGANSLGVVSVSPPSVLVNSGGALRLTNGATTDKPFSLAGSGISSTGALVQVDGTNTLSGAVTLAAAATIGVASGADLSLTGTISGSSTLLTKAGAGTLKLKGLNNTFTGGMTVSAGTLEFFRDGSLTASGNINIENGATLKHTGGYYGAISRPIYFPTAAGSASVTLDASGNGAGTLLFSSFGISTAAGAFNKTLVLTGSNTYANTINAVLSDVRASTSGTLAINKTGTGTWMLPLTNSYTGGTTISAGTLVAQIESGAARFGAGLVTVESSGTLQTLTGINQKGRHAYSAGLTFQNNARIRIGGTVSTGTIRLNGTLTLPTGSDKTTWDLRNDPLYKKAGTYTLFEFAPGVSSVPSGGTLASNVTVLAPTGRTVTSLVPTAEDAANGIPARINVTLT